jgi:hypothetical protein
LPKNFTGKAQSNHDNIIISIINVSDNPKTQSKALLPHFLLDSFALESLPKKGKVNLSLVHDKPTNWKNQLKAVFHGYYSDYNQLEKKKVFKLKLRFNSLRILKTTSFFKLKRLTELLVSLRI